MPWDYPDTEYRKQAADDPLWHLERLVTYGLQGEKIDRATLARYLPELRIPEGRRKFLELILWSKPS